MATIRDNYSKEMFFGRKGLTFIAKGHWPGEIDSLSTVLRQFYDLNKKTEFGKYLWVFAMINSDGKPMVSSTDSNEHMWLVATAWTSEQRQALPETDWVIENGQTYYPSAPYGKIFATKIAKGWRVELWHDGVGIDSGATEGYMGRLFQTLIEDGLQPVAPNVWQSELTDTLLGKEPYRRLPPGLVAEIIGHTIMGVGYTYKKENDVYIIIHEEGELGRILLLTQLNYGPYFSTTMPHKTGLGERYLPKSPKEGFQPVDGDVARFLRLIQMINDHIAQRIEINDVMNKQTAVTEQPEPQQIKSQVEDEDERLAKIAHEYSQRGHGGVRPDSIKLWEKIVEFKKIPLTDSQVIERISSLSERNFRYHKEKMKKTGYWREAGLVN